MPGGQPGGEDFLRLEEMAEVCPGEMAAGIAVAGGIDGSEIPFEPGVFNVDAAPAGEEGAGAGGTAGQHAVEHIHAPQRALDEAIRLPPP